MPNIHMVRRVLLKSPAVVAPGGGFTSPLDLPNLFAWYEADAGVLHGGSPALTGESVDTWQDQSGNGRHLTQTGSPLVVTYSTSNHPLNGLGTISKGGANSLMISSAVDLSGTTVSVWVLVKQTGGPSGRVVSYNISASDTGATAFIAAYFASDTTPTAYQNGNKSTGTVVDESWNTLCSVWDGTNNTLYINNVGQTPVASTPTFAASGLITVGDKDPAGGSNGLTGAFAEIVIVKGVMSSTDRSNMASYSLAKWGV